MRRIGAAISAFLGSPALLCGTGLLVVAVASRVNWLPLPRCLWKTWLGVSCPGCGLTRASLAILRGEFVEAWALHPWAFLLVPAAGWYALRPLWRRWFPRNHGESGGSPRRAALLPVAVMLLFSIWAVWRALGPSPS